MNGLDTIVTAHDLGPLGCLLQVRPNGNLPGTVDEKPIPVVVLDRSGSMDKYCELFAKESIPYALQQCDYSKTDKVAFITFDSITERVLVSGRDPTIEELQKMHVTCRGSTYMRGAVDHLIPIINLHPALHIIVISDGEISDQSETRSAALNAVKNFTASQKDVRISATLLRFLSSGRAQPDTSALACFGNFCNTGQKTELIDVTTGDSLETAIWSMTEAIVGGMRSSGCGKSIELSGGIFKQSPTSQAVPRMQISCSTSTMVLMAEMPKTIRLGTQEYPVVNLGTPKTVETLDSFVDLIGQRLRMTIVAANGKLGSEMQAQVDQTVQYFDQLQTFIRSLHAEALGQTNLTIAGRLDAITREVRSRTATAIDRLRQQLNSNRVNSANAQQTADWLRGLTDNKSGRAVARRTDGQDPNGDSQSAIKTLAAAIANVPGNSNNDTAVSFYSQASPMESIEGVKSLASVVDSVTLSDWQKCVGGVGVAVKHRVGDFADPFNVRIEEVYPVYLSECDLFMAGVQAGASQTNVLKCPGQPDSEISAVVVLRPLDPLVYDLYMTKGRPLAEFQCSAQMRRVVAPIPYDIIAFNAAAVWRILQVQPAALKSVEREILDGLMENLQFLIGSVYKSGPFDELFVHLQRPDPRPWLNGENNVSNVLRPMTCLLRFGLTNSAAMRSMFYLETYHQCSRVIRASADPVAARRDALNQLLAIDFGTHATPLKPLFEEEAPVHYDHVSIADISSRLPNWVPKLSSYIGVHSFLSKAGSSDLLTFGCTGLLLRVVAATQALKCANESARIDTKQLIAHVPDPTTEDEALDYLRVVQQSIYAEEYKTRLAAKLAEEGRIVTERTVKQLFDTASFDEFKSILISSKIINRDHPGFLMLWTELVNSDPLSNNRTQQKLSVLLTGRDLKKPSEAVWANGNIWNKWKDFTHDQKFFSEAAEQALIGICSKYGIHKYRGHNNRHKHGNDFPSYFALGYKDLKHMQASVSEEEFRRYVNDHCVMNKCCNPNESEKPFLKGF